MKGAWVCDNCKEVIRDVYQRAERRVEYRLLKNLKRYRTVTTGYLCKDCVDAEVEKLRPSQSQGNQGTLI